MPRVQDLLLYLENFDPVVDVLDILMVSGVIYGFLYLLRGTQAANLIRGTLILSLIIYLVASELELTAFSWLVERTLPALVFVLPVIFQQEIRRALERVGRAGILFGPGTEPEITRALSRVSHAAQRLSEQRLGALIVLERESGLQDVIESGVMIDSRITSELLVTIFYPKTPLHDGAVICRGERIIAAAAVLPLATDIKDRRLGTRHRAAIGITQITDAVAVVVSEETGIISLASNGRLIRNLEEGRLNRLLQSFFVRTPSDSLIGRFRAWRRTITQQEESV